jgi:hypothetical protein
MFDIQGLPQGVDAIGKETDVAFCDFPVFGGFGADRKQRNTQSQTDDCQSD